MDLLEFPKGKRYQILLDGKVTAFPQSSDKAPTEIHVADQMDSHTYHSILPAISNQFVRHEGLANAGQGFQQKS